MHLTQHAIGVIRLIALENHVNTPEAGRILFVDTQWAPLRWPTLVPRYGKEPKGQIDNLRIPLSRQQLIAMHVHLNLLPGGSVVIELVEAFTHGLLQVDYDPKNVERIIKDANTNVSTETNQS